SVACSPCRSSIFLTITAGHFRGGGSLINRAVTKGLNPDAPMKDSGVDWIGEIPAHWEVLRNAALFEESKKSGTADLPVLSVSIHHGVSREELSEEENLRSAIKIADRTSYVEVLPGYIAYNMMRAWQGGIGAVYTHGMVSPAYVVAKPRGPINAEYFELLYRTDRFIGQMDQNSKGITDFRKRLYWEEFKTLLTLVPSPKEQNEIAAFCGTIVSACKDAVEATEREISTLKEFKQTLIANAVTGKIKI
ncbi:restriction endonuclease subunit S, partial [Ruegeria faecimaris]|uniref:restriction endonuclease subunit S n=1 Tax=Ruegeria faecimaris TaxID=686389 RepID=UPI00232BDEDC